MQMSDLTTMRTVAMNGLTQLVATEIQGDFKINAVCPGWARTDFLGASRF